MNLASLVLYVDYLFCPGGCCRTETLNLLCDNMGRSGPWYTLKPSSETRSYFRGASTRVAYVQDIRTKRQKDFEVIGLIGEDEKDIFERVWGWGSKGESFVRERHRSI